MDLLEHQRMLTAIASGLVGSADADDVVQETFLRALAQPPPDTSTSVAPWLVCVAKNLAMDVLRRRGRFVALTEEADHDVGEPLLPEHDATTLLAGLGLLSEGEVAVLLLRDWMDLDVDEVAAALGAPAGSVRVLHHRARRKAAIAAPLADALAASIGSSRGPSDARSRGSPSSGIACTIRASRKASWLRTFGSSTR